MTQGRLSLTEIDRSVGFYLTIHRAVAAERRAGIAPRSHPFDRFIVETALDLSAEVRDGRLAQAEFNQLLWGLLQLRARDEAMFALAVRRVEPQLLPRLRQWQQIATGMAEPDPDMPPRLRQIRDRQIYRLTPEPGRRFDA